MTPTRGRILVVTHSTGSQEFDLNTILREILEEFMASRDWSEARMARELEIPQRTLNQLMRGGSKFNLTQVTKICAALNMRPTMLFGSHPAYAADIRELSRYGKDALYDRFCSALSLSEARDLVRLLEHTKDYGVLDYLLQGAALLVDMSKAVRRRKTQSERPDTG